MQTWRSPKSKVLDAQVPAPKDRFDRFNRLRMASLKGGESRL